MSKFSYTTAVITLLKVYYEVFRRASEFKKLLIVYKETEVEHN